MGGSGASTDADSDSRRDEDNLGVVVCGATWFGLDTVLFGFGFMIA